LAANVYHHISPDERAASLTLCRDLILDDGAIFLFEHNPYNPLTRYIFNRCPFDINASMLSLSSSIALAKMCRLSSLRYGYTLFFPKQLSFLRFLEPHLRWLPLGAQYYIEMKK